MSLIKYSLRTELVKYCLTPREVTVKRNTCCAIMNFIGKVKIDLIFNAPNIFEPGNFNKINSLIISETWSKSEILNDKRTVKRHVSNLTVSKLYVVQEFTNP